MAHIILCGREIKSSQASRPHDLITQPSASHLHGAEKKNDDAPVIFICLFCLCLGLLSFAYPHHENKYVVS